MALPLNNILKAMREVQGMNGIHISNEASVCMAKCTEELLLFIAQEANEISEKEGRSTLTESDILRALDSLGFHQPYTDTAKSVVNQP